MARRGPVRAAAATDLNPGALDDEHRSRSSGSAPASTGAVTCGA
jgi:hypothetical protein